MKINGIGEVAQDEILSILTSTGRDAYQDGEISLEDVAVLYKVEQVKKASIVGRMADTFTVNYDRIPDNLKDQLSPADLAHLVDAFYRCYGENRRLSGRISPISRRITVPQWQNVPAGAEVESGFHYTMKAPDAPGTYTLYELTDRKNCHRGWEWEKDGAETPSST